MRILHVVESFYPSMGGIQVLVGALALEQVARGHEVRVVVTGVQGEGEPDEWRGLPVHRLDYRGALERQDRAAVGRANAGMVALRRDFAPQVTHVHLAGPGAALHVQANLFEPGPWLVTVHVPLPARALAPGEFLGKVLLAADRVVAISEHIRSMVHACVGADRPVERIYNGVEELPCDGEPEGSASLLFLGRLVEEKGADVAIRALAEVAAELPEARLVVCGDGPQRAELGELAGALGLAERVEFQGRTERDELPHFLARSAIVLVPSVWEEPFGLVPVEAAFAGRPVIASDRGALPEVVLDGETGLVVPGGSAGALAAAIRRLAGDPGLARGLGERARASARARFGWERFTDDYEEAYDALAHAGAEQGQEGTER